MYLSKIGYNVKHCRSIIFLPKYKNKKSQKIMFWQCGVMPCATSAQSQTEIFDLLLTVGFLEEREIFALFFLLLKYSAIKFSSAFVRGD